MKNATGPASWAALHNARRPEETTDGGESWALTRRVEALEKDTSGGRHEPDVEQIAAWALAVDRAVRRARLAAMRTTNIFELPVERARRS
jgi:hypothetical protein